MPRPRNGMIKRGILSITALLELGAMSVILRGLQHYNLDERIGKKMSEFANNSANASSEGTHATDAQDKAQDIVKAALMHVPFDGWSEASLKLGAADCGLDDKALAHYLPNGVDDAIMIYADIADRDMVAGFQGLEEAPEKMHLKIRALILIRLTQAAHHKQTVSKTLSYLAQPQQASKATKLLYNTVDMMWRTAGDDATDVSFYSKRATLAAVYSATLLAFLADDSGDMAKTEAFLDRRLSEIARIPKFTSPVKQAASQAASLIGTIASGIMRGKRPF